MKIMSKTNFVNISSKKIAKDIMHIPETIKHDATITDFAKKLAELDVSRLVIKKDEKHIGIATTKDWAFYLHMNKNDEGVSNIPVTEIMHDIIFIDENIPMPKCAQIMLEKKISSLAIGNKECIQGIFTKTDLLQYYEYHLSEGHRKVDDYISRNYLSVDSDVNAMLALDEMIIHNVTRVIVQDSDKIPKGIATLGNFMNPLMVIGSSNLKNNGNIVFDETLTIGDIMITDFLAVPIGTDLKIACKTLLESHVDGIGITRKDNTLAGVLSKTDIMRAIESMN